MVLYVLKISNYYVMIWIWEKGKKIHINYKRRSKKSESFTIDVYYSAKGYAIKENCMQSFCNLLFNFRIFSRLQIGVKIRLYKSNLISKAQIQRMTLGSKIELKSKEELVDKKHCKNIQCDPFS